MFTKESFTVDGYTIDFAIDYPKGFDGSGSYPVLFYFHGIGGIYQGVEHVAEFCPARRERMTDDMPFIIVAPACMDYTWMGHFSQVIDLIKDIIARPYVDEKRIYLSGSSMGGYTCFMLALHVPELFAAAAVCCGGGIYAIASNIKFPVRAYHGLQDPVVLHRESEMMVNAINSAGGNAELITYDYCDHDAWTPTFTNHETYRWLLSHTK